ncbi:MAG: TatD family hydrolase [Oscillospiraceae bacterium]|jgi:TatD DNase family protein|nr:TatD family hydrolase [Oscillospiraceae bacterium]
MIKLFDTHTHYDDSAYEDDRDELITRLLNGNVAGFIAVGCTLERSEKAVRLAEKYPPAYAAVGIHPQDVYNLPPNYLQILEKFAESEKVVALGEIGLEYFRKYDKTQQNKIFREQLELAQSLNLPVIIHSREAFSDTLEFLREYTLKGLKFVCHCFSEDSEAVLSLAELGVYVSFTGAIAFEKNTEKAVNACKNVPLELLLLETDCPYLAPPPFRGKRCDSSMAWYTAQKIAQIKKRTTDEIVEICNDNAMRFFMKGHNHGTRPAET